MKVKYITFNRTIHEYKIGNKVVDFKTWWFMAKHLIITKPGCKVQDDNYILMYEA